jgi:three-Cys-motif partner protein
LSALKFRTLERLAKVQRMDLIVHFPTGDIKRNVKQNQNTRQWLTEAIGTQSWMTVFKSMSDIGRLIELFKEQLSSLGYGSKSAPSEPIKNNQNLPLYYLVYASKHDRGDAIWKSITKNKPSGQRGLGF